MSFSWKTILLSLFVATIAIVTALVVNERRVSQQMFAVTKNYNDDMLSQYVDSNDLSPLTEDSTAIVFGGTSGICEAVAIRLASAGVKNITIVGRNENEGKRIVDEMTMMTTTTTTSDQGIHQEQSNNKNGRAGRRENHFQFVQSDLVLLKNCNDLVNKNEKIKSNHQNGLDYVVFCQTKATLQGRTETPIEKIDEKLSLNLYSRMYLTKLLLPWLKKAAAKSAQLSSSSSSATSVFVPHTPRVLSILSAGAHPPYTGWQTDTRLSAGYTQKSAADITSFYTDLMFDKFARENPSIRFIHASPGFVKTQWGSDMPLVVRYFIRFFQSVGGRPAVEAAEFMIRPLFDPDVVGGEVVLVDQYGRLNVVHKTALHVDAAIEHVWKDTMMLFQEVESTF